MRNLKMTICLAVVVLFMATGQGFGLTQFKDGEIHNISYTINDEVQVDYGVQGMGTTFNLLSGGSIAGGSDYWPNNLKGYEDSHINISGGTLIYTLYAWDNCQVNFSEGMIIGCISAHDNSQVVLSGGATTNGINASGNSHVTVSGGSTSYLIADYDSRVSISGGSISNAIADMSLWTHRNSKTIISGGTMKGIICLQDISCIEFIGTDFAIDGSPFGYGKFNPPISGYGCVLTGTLANGDYLDNKLVFYDGSSIILTPEPATLLLLGLGSVMLRRKR